MTQYILLTMFLFTLCPCARAQDVGNLCEKIRRSPANRSEEASRKGGEHYISELTSKDLTKPQGQQILHQIQFKYSADYAGDSYLVSSVQVAGSVPNANNFCIGINPDYCFELSKKRAGSPWAVRKLHVTGDPDLDTQKLGFSVSYRRPSRRPKSTNAAVVYGFRSVKIDYSSLDTRPDTTVKGVTTNSAGMVVITFETDLPPESPDQGGARPRVRNELTLDPGHNYIVLGFNQDYSQGNKVHMLHNTLDYKFDGKLITHIVSTQTEKLTAGDVLETHAENFTTTDCKYGPIPAREFTLSAFGFPEPPGLPERSTGWPTYVWALIVAGICATIIVAVRWRKSRA